MYFSRRLFFFAGGIFIFFSVSCSFNQYGIPGSIIGQNFQERTCSKTISYTALGLHFFSIPGPGVQLGCRKIKLTYPVVQEKNATSNCGQYPDCCVSSPDMDLKPAPKYDSSPIHTDIENMGVGISVSPTNFGICLGLQRKRMLKSEPENSIVFISISQPDGSYCSCGTIIKP